MFLRKLPIEFIAMLDEVRKFHLFQQFKSILSDCWNMDILIIAKKDNKFFHEKTKKLSNPVVESLFESPVFKNHLFSSISSCIKNTPKNSRELKTVLWKQTGLELWVLPLSFNKFKVSQYSCQFFLIGVGFGLKRQKELKQALSYIGFSEKESEKKIQQFKKLDSFDQSYLKRMLKVLSDEFFISFNPLLKKESSELFKQKNLPTYGFMRGCSPAMQYIFNVLKKIRNYDGYVLIEGEEGTGKRLLAKTIHAESLRSHKAFQVQNFSVFRGRFLESTLFFNHPESSKAFRHKKALAQKLEGGTLLLNEIGKTSLEFQKNLLNFLNFSVLFNKGELKNKKYNVRIISSSSEDLRELVKKGDFIESLYFTISAMSVNIPPLRYRKMDIPLLVDYFLNQKSPHKYLKFSKPAFRFLYEYSWPGNIAELESEIEKVVSLAQKDQTILTEKELSPHIRNFSSQLHGVLNNYKDNSLKNTLESVEKELIYQSLRKNNWNKTRVAKILGISRTSLIFKTKEYGLIKQGA